LSLVTRLRRPTADEPTPDQDPPEVTADLDPPDRTADQDPPADHHSPDRRRGRVRLVLGWALTVLAAASILFALVVPDSYDDLHARSFVRLPVEAILALAVLVVLPPRPRRIVAVTIGVLLGLLTIVKVVDIGFTAVLARPFDLVLDWILLGDATGVVQDSIGTLGAVLTVVGACLLVIAILALMTLAVLRLTRLVAGHHTGAVRTVAVLAAVWLAGTLFGVQLPGGGQVASRTDAALVYHRAQQIRTGLHDQAAFEAEAKVDPFKDTPGSQLLNGLRGKDVLVTFVESYGRYAVEDPRFAPPVDAQLDAATTRLDAAGFGSRSAYLSSSTVGGASWLAHATLLSGLYINNQHRYRSLVASDRLTLSSAFNKAGWKTVSVEPAINAAWPEGKFFGYQQDYDERNLGYRGSRFSYATMPDQYIYSVFQHNERKPGHAPVFGEITTVSSHSPWTPIPKMVGWDRVGDGSVFDDPANQQGGPPGSILGNPDKLRASYIRSIQYSLDALVSYVERYGDDNLVLVFLGDHQPARVVTGAGASRDVPITIVAKDPKVLDRISSWHWTPGLRPTRNAPVSRMDTFRDRFLTTFGPAAPAR
jgi:Sulfatase